MADKRTEIERLKFEIKRRGGAAKAPQFAKRLADLQAGGSNPGGSNPGTGPATVESMETWLNNVFQGMGTLDLSGAPKVMTAADLEQFRQQNQDALYNEETKYLERDRARSKEEAMQEMANRGIPYNPAAAMDPNTDDLYGKTLGAVEENYAAQRNAALDRARTGADQRMATQAGVNKAASDQYVNNAVQGWQSQFDKIASGNSVLQTLMTKYGIDQATAQEILNRKSNEKLTMAGIRAKGSGGGGSGDSGGGFEIIG